MLSLKCKVMATSSTGDNYSIIENFMAIFFTKIKETLLGVPLTTITYCIIYFDIGMYIEILFYIKFNLKSS